MPAGSCPPSRSSLSSIMLDGVRRRPGVPGLAGDLPVTVDGTTQDVQALAVRDLQLSAALRLQAPAVTEAMEGQVADDLRLVVLEGEPLDAPLAEELRAADRRKSRWKKQGVLAEQWQISLDVVVRHRLDLGVDNALYSLSLRLVVDCLSHGASFRRVVLSAPESEILRCLARNAVVAPRIRSICVVQISILQPLRKTGVRDRASSFELRGWSGYPDLMEALASFSEKTRAWFERSFAAPTPAQELGWPAIASGSSVLIQ